MSSLIDKILHRLNGSANRSQYHGVTYHVTTGNTLDLLDTPRKWGQTVAEIHEKRDDATGGDYGSWLCQAIETTIGAAEDLVDITTLGNLPDGKFRAAFFKGLSALATKPVVVRVLVSRYHGNAKQWASELFAHLSKAVGNDLKKLKLSFYIGNSQISLNLNISETAWNHAKIIAVDGKRAIVGGHNWWSTDYLQYPPVSDVSVRVNGPAAYDAHQFADCLWGHLAAHITGGVWYWEPGMTALGTGKIRRRSPKDQSPVHANHGRMISLGRLGPLSSDLAGDASDHAKEIAVTHAKRSIYLSQQDLLLPIKTTAGHPFVDHLAMALLRNRELEVKAVISTIHGGSGTTAYVTGNLGTANVAGYGAKHTYAYVRSRIAALAVGVAKSSAAAAELTRHAMSRFELTSLRLSPKDPKDEGSYAWPGDYHVKCMPALTSFRPAPANHAKVYIIDEEAFYVGSDNLYPNRNQEFGYLIEDKKLTASFIADYWEKIWNASKHAVVKESV